MADIVNLRQARKNRVRAAKQERAEENRAIHGRTKSERLREKAIAAKETAILDAHRRDRRSEDE